MKRFKQSLSDLASRAVNYFGRSGRGLFSAFTFLTGSNRNWNKEAGPRYDNSAVFTAIQYLIRQITGDPRFIVQQQRVTQKGKTEWIEVTHELPKLIKRGRVMRGDQLIGGAILSLVVSGNAYWLKDRALGTGLTGFVYVPHWSMEAIRDRPSPFGDRMPDGSHLVVFYEYTNPDGQKIPFRVEDVVHFRWGVDPVRPENGLAPIAASLREVVTDNEAATLGAALLKNAGIPGIAISPKEKIETDLTPDQRADFNAKFQRRVTGDMAGTPFVPPYPCDFTVIGFSPEQLVLDKTRALSVTRIFGPLGIDPMVCGYPSEQKTYSNFEEALRHAWRSGCKPVLRIIAETIDEQCLQTDYGTDDTYRAYWDLSEVAEEQDDKFKVAEMMRGDWDSDVIMRSEIRAARGWDVDEKRDNVFKSATKPVVEKVNPAADEKKRMAARMWANVERLQKLEPLMED